MVRLAARRPAGMQRRQHELAAEPLEDLRHPGREVIVEQDGAGVEVGKSKPVALAHQRLQRQRRAVRQLVRRRRRDLRQQRADAHVQPRLAQDENELRDVLQVEHVARVVLGDQQQAAGLGAELLDCRHCRLHAERVESRVEVVEATGKQVGIDRCQLEAGVAQVGRGIEGRRVLVPLRTQPALDLRRGVEEAALEVEQRPVEGGGQVRNHGRTFSMRFAGIACFISGILHRCVTPPRDCGSFRAAAPAEDCAGQRDTDRRRRSRVPPNRPD